MSSEYEVNRLQHIQNCLARTFVQASKFQHITPVLKSLHWLKVSERIEYKIIFLTDKILNTTQPPYCYDLISIQPHHVHKHNTRSSPYVVSCVLQQPELICYHRPVFCATRVGVRSASVHL